MDNINGEEDNHKDLIREISEEFEGYLLLVKTLLQDNKIFVIKNQNRCTALEIQTKAEMLQMRPIRAIPYSKDIHLGSLKFFYTLKPDTYNYVRKFLDIINDKYDDKVHEQGASAFYTMTFAKNTFLNEEFSYILDIDDKELLQSSFELFETTLEQKSYEEYKNILKTLIVLIFKYRSKMYRYNFIQESLRDGCCIQPSEKYKNKSYEKRQNILKQKIEEVKELMQGDGALTMEAKGLIEELKKAYQKPQLYVSKIDRRDVQKPLKSIIKSFLVTHKIPQNKINDFMKKFDEINVQNEKPPISEEEKKKLTDIMSSITAEDIQKAYTQQVNKESNGGFPSFIKYTPYKK